MEGHELSAKVRPTHAWLGDTLQGLTDFTPADQIHIDPRVEGSRITFNVRVPATDLGKVIGKQGRTARALRVLLAARGRRDGLSYGLDIENHPDQETTA